MQAKLSSLSCGFVKMNEYKIGFCTYTKDELKDAISALSTIRAYFDPGNDVEYKYICACYAGMSAIEEIMGVGDEQ